ncbi:MAG TPA: hypothetical protein VM266_02030 [Solirubrobacteraceae bacterium]|nr:hypothetical protein [Solirubrobacteraceae bacterium]
MRKHFRMVAAAAALGALLVPAAAQAASYDVYAGPPKPLSGVPQSADANHFFPSKLKVAKGDTVAFHFRGFHAIFAPKKGQAPPPFEIADPSGTKVSGAKDAAGNDFWFNGQTRVLINPLAAFPTGDGTHDGKSADGSGVPDGEKPKPYKLKFTKTGSFTYHCPIHPGMKGKVTVVKKAKKRDGSAKVKTRIAREVAKITKAIKKRADFRPSEANLMQAGNDTHDIAFFSFFPNRLEVKAGTTVTFRNSPVSGEPHTFSFGPLDYLKGITDTLIAPEGGGNGPPTLVFNPLAAFPSDTPGSAWSVTSSSHGNGFFNTGIVDSRAASPPPNQTKVTFPNPGTYHLICLIHGDQMAADVVVTQ